MQFKYLLFAVLLIVGSVSCEEVGPSINLVQTDRVVVIEEYTGVRCVNCPDGSDKIQDIITQKGDDKVIAISIHAGIFSAPYNGESNEDFRTPDGTSLLSYLGEPAGNPTAVINRVQYDGQQYRAVGLNDWSGYINEELQKTPMVRLDMTKDYNETTRELNGSVELFFFEAISGNVNMTFLITEDDIEDVQVTLDGKKYDYKHKHVLRKVISSSYTGDLIGTDIAANFTTTINFNYVLPAEFNAEKCNIVAFVNRDEGATLDVLQATKAHVVD